MTTLPTGIHAPAAPGRDSNGLTKSAAIYLAALGTATLAATAPFYGDLLDGPTVGDWERFAALVAGAALAQLFVVRSPRNQSYHTSYAFFLAAALLLPPELIILVGLVANVPEWLKERYPWYIQSFNIFNFTLNMLGAWAAFTLVHDQAGLGRDMGFALGGLAACGVFVLLNHVVLATMLKLARGHSLRETGLFTGESLTIELVLTALGVVLATFWLENPWLIPAALSPLLIVHRSLSVPQLEAEARVDPKTGLFNARHFANALEEEIGRAVRFNRPLSLIMADLDLLRDINNSYGHLAGDAVLQGIAENFRQQLRHYDIPARFGGEEFAILLPETSSEQALEIAERIRRSVAACRFDVETSSEPISVTVSIGVASFPQDATDANELIHQADLAVYRAKLQGRNRVLGVSTEQLLVPAEQAPG